ncbi:probable membrane-associated kinase regulator 2 [Ananas comosus]|uniref:Probable membrane-associated kinase regulator 2 n=1 Tax=Ananas comosus TaxID=4615 RepID=A0A6P5GBR3_ANACO|nr:probable membrane-associated kinase regulator 2 [Ananas comosus]
MRVLSLLRARRGGGGGGGGGGNPSVIRATADAEEGEWCGGGGAGAGDDDGPFFDLEIAAVPFFEDRSLSAESEPESEGEGEGDGAALDFVISSDKLFARARARGGGGADSKLGIASNASDASPKPQFPASLFRSAARLRVFRLGFKKPKPPSTTPPPPPPTTTTKPIRGEGVLLKLRVVEEVPVAVAALLARDHSSRSSVDASPPSSSEERRSSHRVIERCLSKIKPILHARVSRGDAASAAPPAESPARFRVVARRLRKSRSASSAVSAAVRSPAPVRRDDSLLEQQDGIQSAIAHCKRSLCAGSELPLVRSRSDPGDGKRNGV